MQRIVLRFDCPECRKPVELQPACEAKANGFNFPLGDHPCPGCGKELTLVADWDGSQKMGLRLVYLKTTWSLEDILNREG